MNTGLNWYEAEVVKVYLDDRVIIKDVGLSNIYDESGQKIQPQKANPIHYGTIRVKISALDTKYTDLISRIVRPLDPHMVFMPLVGETVSCVQISSNWYFLSSGRNSGQVNNNIKRNRSSDGESRTMNDDGTIAGNQLDFDGGDFFRPKFISRPKINEGDTLLQGRYGNFINFSSNVNVLEDSKNIISKKLAGGSIKIVNSFASEDVANRDIEFYSDQKGNKKTEKLGDYRYSSKKYKKNLLARGYGQITPVPKDINYDGSSIYLLRNEATNIRFGSPVPKAATVTQGGNQIVMNSDHMIFNSRRQSLVFSAKQNVSIHSNKGIRLYVNDKPSEDDVLNGRIFLGGLPGRIELSDGSIAKGQVGEGDKARKPEPIVRGVQLAKLLNQLGKALEVFATSGETSSGALANILGAPGQDVQLKSAFSKLKQEIKFLNESDLIELEAGAPDVTKFKDGGDGEGKSIDRLFSKKVFTI
tara:strand:- start:5277 stop:6695 length:1419 start_codon:yes stop_codon:yes gene_type:complete